MFFAHGTPGSRLTPFSEEVVHFVDSNARLISHDRAGCGDSPRKRGRKVVDSARVI